MRTLAIASSASAAAALLTSQLWIAGTWIAAAMTPVIVALVSEMLHRPTERIARSLTADRAALPAAGGAAPPARPGADVLPERAPEEPGAGPEPPRPPTPGTGSEAPVRVYRSGGAGPHGTLPGDSEAGARGAARSGAGAGGRPAPTRRRKIAYRAVFATAGLAFVIAVAVITVPELLAGGSVGRNDGGTTFFSDSRKDRDREQEEQAPQDTTEEEPAPQDQQQEQPEPTTDEEAPPEEETAPTEETAPQDAPPGEPLPDTQAVPPTEQP
jgi:hypothetical protein